MNEQATQFDDMKKSAGEINPVGLGLINQRVIILLN